MTPIPLQALTRNPYALLSGQESYVHFRVSRPAQAGNTPSPWHSVTLEKGCFQLRETTMKPGQRSLLKVTLAKTAERETGKLVDSLMGKKPELRFSFIQENARLVKDLDI